MKMLGALIFQLTGLEWTALWWYLWWAFWSTNVLGPV